MGQESGKVIVRCRIFEATKSVRDPPLPPPLWRQPPIPLRGNARDFYGCSLSGRCETKARFRRDVAATSLPTFDGSCPRADRDFSSLPAGYHAERLPI